MSSFAAEENCEEVIRAFLLRTAELLHRHGTPSYRLEGVMGKVAESLNIVADMFELGVIACLKLCTHIG